MEKEKKVYSITESQMLVIDKKDFENNRFIFPGVCECACLVMETESGKVVLYHEYLSDSVNDAKKKLQDLMNNDKIESVLIFGGNLNDLFHANKNTKDIKLYHGFRYLETNKRVIRPKKRIIEPEVQEKTEDVDYNKICQESMKGKMTLGDVVFRVGSNINNLDIEYIEQIKKTPQSVNEYDEKAKNTINNRNVTCNNYELYSYKTLYFSPKYENFCGSENLQKLRDIITDLGFDKAKIKEMRTPNGEDIEIISNDQHFDIQVASKDIKKIKMTPKDRMQQSPGKTGYNLDKFSLYGR